MFAQTLQVNKRQLGACLPKIKETPFGDGDRFGFQLLYVKFFVGSNLFCFFCLIIGLLFKDLKMFIKVYYWAFLIQRHVGSIGGFHCSKWFC